MNVPLYCCPWFTFMAFVLYYVALNCVFVIRFLTKTTSFVGMTSLYTWQVLGIYRRTLKSTVKIN